jgi:chromosomal replication initiator protein
MTDPEPVPAPSAHSESTSSSRAQHEERAEAGVRPLGSARLSLPETWRALQNAVRSRIAPEQFATWFRRAMLTHVDDKVVRLAVQNPFTLEWIKSYYVGVIEESIVEVIGHPRTLEFVVVPELMIPAAVDARTDAAGRRGEADAGGDRLTAEARAREAASNVLTEAALVSDVGLNPRYKFDNFVVGPCNRFAHAAAVGAAEQPGKAYNPFFLHGSVGLGKTHLLQSLCFTMLQRNPKTRILYLSCETFVNHFISALENGDLQKFRNKYRNVDVLVVDDIHVLANKERTQEEFFHTFNTLYQAGKQIVLSSDSPPKEIPTLQERLVSRFRWGLVTEIEPPCYETRMAILKRKSREKGREIPDDVARLLAERIDSNIRELEGAVTKLISYSNLTGAAVSSDLAREVLRDLFAVRRGAPSLDDIVAIVVERFGVKLSELQSRKRTNAVAFPRQVSMYIARQITRHSLEEIGGFFGGRDHSTVLYAVEKVGEVMEKDPDVRILVEGFLSQLQGPSN